MNARLTLGLTLAALLAPAATALLVALPMILPFKTLPMTISEEIVALSRDHTTDDLTQGMRRWPGAADAETSTAEAVAAALLQGTVLLDHATADMVFDPPFDADLVLRGNSSWQLWYSGFIVPEIFLTAYENTGRDDFLAAARDFILGWWRFEQNTWLAEGFIWNDHSIASRAHVLADFWAHYRDSDLFNVNDATEILQLVWATARLLGRDDLYTYRTNHGTMQSVALARLALVFPYLPDMKERKQIALDRLVEQLPFFIGSEGVILEHSLGYHVLGVQLLNAAAVIFEATGRQLPPEIDRRLKRGEEFLQVVQTPDGMLPRIGDTDGHEAREYVINGEPLAPGSSSSIMLPRSGFAVHRTASNGSDLEADTQLTAFWGNLPHMGHKHADDLSVHLWADGLDWWTAVGYWPYFRSDRDVAIGWDGSNAPHLKGEAFGSIRRPAIIGYGAGDEMWVLDLLRDGPGPFRVRRQIIALADAVWLVLDFFAGAANQTARTVWLSDPDTKVEAGRNGRPERLTAEETTHALTFRVLTSGETDPVVVEGQTRPLVGWVWDDRRAREAPALVVEQPAADGWSIMVAALQPRESQRLRTDEITANVDNAANWIVRLPLDGQELLVSRNQDLVQLSDSESGSPPLNVPLTPVVGDDQFDRGAYERFVWSQEKYGKTFKPHTFYRVRMLWIILGLGISTVIYVVLTVRLRPSLRPYALMVPVVAWVGLAAFLEWVYFGEASI